jgi:hypothetical protein
MTVQTRKVVRAAFVVAAAGFGAGAGGAATAQAHSTGYELRRIEQCRTLPGNDQAGERANCIRCVTRPRPHHFHPDYPPGERCRPDNGRP